MEYMFALQHDIWVDIELAKADSTVIFGHLRKLHYDNDE